MLELSCPLDHRWTLVACPWMSAWLFSRGDSCPWSSIQCSLCDHSKMQSFWIAFLGPWMLTRVLLWYFLTRSYSGKSREFAWVCFRMILVSITCPKTSAWPRMRLCFQPVEVKQMFVRSHFKTHIFLDNLETLNADLGTLEQLDMNIGLLGGRSDECTFWELFITYIRWQIFRICQSMFSNVFGIHYLPMDVNLTTAIPLMLAHGCPLDCCLAVELKRMFLLLTFQNEHVFEYLWILYYNLGTRVDIV